jgi:hypothetical protein
MPVKAVVLDANLLVLLVVGLASPSYIIRHKRLRAYSVQDFSLLQKLLSAAPRIIVTPNTITETSNLAVQIADPARKHVSAALKLLLMKTEEVYIDSRAASEHVAYPRLGITDSVLLGTLAGGYTLLTADLDLYLEAHHQGYMAINFIHHIEANRPNG